LLITTAPLDNFKGADMTIADIKTKHAADWERLSGQQQVFLTELFVNHRSGVEAVKVAYPNVQNSDVWLSRLLKNNHILHIIHLYAGTSEIRAALFEVHALLKRSKRKGTNLDLLIAPWNRVAVALEAIAAQGK
jgi:hypothetical protein